ncbi:hypothetical protein [Limosilactobacillus oris]|uniref:hypothetical protein n=1 Tax=Limosilactobacillus oris TaxID=1632 RepID=UPI00242D5F74|nr:hypothetical protein [Limosilactobacillus oris]
MSDLINVAKAVTDPRFSQKFKVFRKSGEWVKGRFIESEKEISMIGVIAPSKPKEIEMIPEGDRVGGEITIHTIRKLYTTRSIDTSEDNEENQGTSDIIEWQSERYKLYQVNDYSQYGYYSSIGMRLVSN